MNDQRIFLLMGLWLISACNVYAMEIVQPKDPGKLLEKRKQDGGEQAHLEKLKKRTQKKFEEKFEKEGGIFECVAIFECDSKEQVPLWQAILMTDNDGFLRSLLNKHPQHIADIYKIFKSPGRPLPPACKKLLENEFCANECQKVLDLSSQ